MRRPSARRTAIALLTGTMAAAAVVVGVTTSALAQPSLLGRAGHGDRRPDYDSRQSIVARVTDSTARSGASETAAIATKAVIDLHAELGVQGIVDIDRATGTPRQVAKLDGFLTGPSHRRPADIAIRYVKAHPHVFGLTPAALASLSLRRDYIDIDGTHHLSFVQSIGGVPVFGNGLKAHVTKDGKLIQIDGSPLSVLPVASGAASIGAAEARSQAVKNVFGTSSAKVVATTNGVTTFSDGGNAKQVYFATARGLSRAWQTVALDQGYLHVIDAVTGQTLFRQGIEHADSADVWDNYPGAQVGGKQHTVSLSKWLPEKAPNLAGNVAHVFTDTNDDLTAQPGEEVKPSGPRAFRFPYVDFSAQDGPPCSAAYPCSWNSNVPNSWQANRSQDAAQIYYFLGTWHDHLAAAPIGFTRAAGNFEAVDGDAIQVSADDGADTAGGLPDADHVNNANMMVPTDGTPPVMRMFLWNQATGRLAGNAGDTADVVYHEYTHGLSSRLVVDANGTGNLFGVQSGALGEAWSDWYAMDYLVGRGMIKDSAGPGDIRLGQYLLAGQTIRSEPMDCPVGDRSAVCPGTATAGPGGYTYGDLGKISKRGLEVHQDGEIWAQTLWDLRAAIGSKKAQSLVTRAMELSPAAPTMLDERNAILAADLVADGGKSQTTIWKVFAKRGMGYFAASLGDDDSSPVEDFAMPPAPNTPRGTVTGTVTDRATGMPTVGIEVTFGGHATGFAGDYRAVTAADGSYRIDGIFPGTYADVIARGQGYDQAFESVSVRPGTNRLNWALRRDWAAAAGGASVMSFTGPDYTPFGCGPSGLIDQSSSTGWGSEVAAGGQQVVIALPAAVDIDGLEVNPSATCGDDLTAGVGRFRMETSADATYWTVAAEGQFPSGTHTATPIHLTNGTAGVRYLRFSELTSQAEDAGQCETPTASGCLFLDSTEVSVYGTNAG